MSDEQRENGHQPYGLPLGNRVYCVPALEQGTIAHGALQVLFSGGSGDMNNFEPASIVIADGTSLGITKANRIE